MAVRDVPLLVQRRLAAREVGAFVGRREFRRNRIGCSGAPPSRRMTPRAIMPA